MFTRRPTVEALPTIEDIAPEYPPFQAVQAHRVIAQTIRKHGGQPPAKLPKRGYRPVARFDINQTAVQVGSVHDAIPALGVETTKRFFAVAAHLGHTGVAAMQRFHVPSETLHTVEVGFTAPQRDSMLVYGLADDFASRRGNGVGASAYTTGEPLLKPGDTTVSFVGIPTSGPKLESRMAAATEIVQNRMHIVSVDNGDYLDTAPAHTEPFQESIANGMGDVLGHIAAGATWREYKGYVQGMLNHRTLFGHDLPDGSGMVAAPHLLARKPLYEQLADGELPGIQDFQFVPMMPDKR